MPQFKKTSCLIPLQLNLIPLTDSTVTLDIVSKHDGRCDSPVAPRLKATDPYVNSTGSLTLLLQLEWKVDLHISTQDEA